MYHAEYRIQKQKKYRSWLLVYDNLYITIYRRVLGDGEKILLMDTGMNLSSNVSHYQKEGQARFDLNFNITLKKGHLWLHWNNVRDEVGRCVLDKEVKLEGKWKATFLSRWTYGDK